MIKYKGILICLWNFLVLLSIVPCFEMIDLNLTPKTESKSEVVSAVTTSTLLGEGPYWSSQTQKLYYVDIIGEKIYSFDPITEKVIASSVCNGPTSYIIGVANCVECFIIGCNRNMTLIQWIIENISASVIGTLTTVDGDRTDTRFNDAKVDIIGRFWGGTMGPEIGSQVIHNRGSLYSIDKTLKPIKRISPVSISNGIAWNSNNNIMYYIDSPTRRIVAFKYDAITGNISNPITVFNFETYNLTGVPDGMTIDTENNLWVANHGGSSVLHINPRTGKLLRTISIPASRVTSVTFGDLFLDTLYVTTASFGLSVEEKQNQPNAGCVFSVKGLGVRGYAPNKFKLS